MNRKSVDLVRNLSQNRMFFFSLLFCSNWFFCLFIFSQFLLRSSFSFYSHFNIRILLIFWSFFFSPETNQKKSVEFIYFFSSARQIIAVCEDKRKCCSLLKSMKFESLEAARSDEIKTSRKRQQRDRRNPSREATQKCRYVIYSVCVCRSIKCNRRWAVKHQRQKTQQRAVEARKRENYEQRRNDTKRVKAKREKNIVEVVSN